MDTQPNFVIGPNECNLTRDNGKVFCNISGIASSWRPVYDYLFVRLEAANELGIFNQNLTFNTPNIGKYKFWEFICVVSSDKMANHKHQLISFTVL